MSQRPDTPSSPSDPAEALSAYLAGELDEAAIDELERRLVTDPALVATLEAMHDAIVVLGDLDAIEPPEGFDDRLAARLAAEDEVVDLVALRRARLRRWGTGLTSAAAAVVLAVAGLALLDRGGFDGSTGEDLAMENEATVEDLGAAMEAPAPTDASIEARAGAEAQRQTDETATSPVEVAPMPMAEAEDQPAAAGADAAAASGPVLADDGVALSGEDELRAHFQGRPEAERLRGTARADAADLASEHARHVRDAAPFADGTHPASCLEAALSGEAHRVVVRVERLRWNGASTLAYLIVTASEGAESLDRVEVWLAAPDGCAEQRRMVVG